LFAEDAASAAGADVAAGAAAAEEVVADVDGDELAAVVVDADVDTAAGSDVGDDVTVACVVSALGGVFGVDKNSDSAIEYDNGRAHAIRTAKTIHLFFMFFSIKTGLIVYSFPNQRTNFIWKSIYPIFPFSAFST
jgi:hypothetical protein